MKIQNQKNNVTKKEEPDKGSFQQIQEQQDNVFLSTSADEATLAFKSFNLVEQSIKSIRPKTKLLGLESSETKALLEEFADDLLHIRKKMNDIEAKQDKLGEQMERIHQTIEQTTRQQVIELEKLRSELLEERKVLANRNAFNAIIPTLDSLRTMLNGLVDDQEQSQIRTQLYAVVSSLRNIIQSLGFIEFFVEEGDIFNPIQMECLGYIEGEANMVLKVIRQGYKIGNNIIRPCGVLIAQPIVMINQKL